MADTLSSIAAHYGSERLAERILAALEAEGYDLTQLTPANMAKIDQLHTRGLQATIAQAALIEFTPDLHVLDVGCGIGGPARYLADTFGCRVTGIDLTAEFVRTAQVLTERMGLSGLADFCLANALDLPFPDACFDVVWSQNVTMNIADKAGFCAEMHRVLKPGGIFAIMESAEGPAGPPYFPLPWARRPEISFLVPPGEMLATLEAAGFSITRNIDDTSESLDSSRDVTQRARVAPRGKLGAPLVLGDDFPERSANLMRSYAEQRLATVMLAAERSR